MSFPELLEDYLASASPDRVRQMLATFANVLTSRPPTYHAVHRMFERANAQAGTSGTLHALRHTAAYRMAEDPSLPLTDVQFILEHAQLTTTQL
ncbi:site-specific integrase [Streptomyces sp. NPDC020800]|uniref:site-specific integrase n=1 Tax=Streptomyces sp. NPDC020800 TaxID=3365092 RepID=UPI0037B08ACA